VESGLDEKVRRPSPIGAMLQSSGLKMATSQVGVLTNAGIWPSRSGTLMWTLAWADGKMAGDKWSKNSRLIRILCAD